MAQGTAQDKCVGRGFVAAKRTESERCSAAAEQTGRVIRGAQLLLGEGDVFRVQGESAYAQSARGL